MVVRRGSRIGVKVQQWDPFASPERIEGLGLGI